MRSIIILLSLLLLLIAIIWPLLRLIIVETLLVLLLTHKNIYVLNVVGNLVHVLIRRAAISLGLNPLQSIWGLIFIVLIIEIIIVHFLQLRRLDLCIVSLRSNSWNVPFVATQSHAVVVELDKLPGYNPNMAAPIRFPGHFISILLLV